MALLEQLLGKKKIHGCQSEMFPYSVRRLERVVVGVHSSGPLVHTTWTQTAARRQEFEDS